MQSTPFISKYLTGFPSVLSLKMMDSRTFVHLSICHKCQWTLHKRICLVGWSARSCRDGFVFHKKGSFERTLFFKGRIFLLRRDRFLFTFITIQVKYRRKVLREDFTSNFKLIAIWMVWEFLWSFMDLTRS